MEKSKVEVFEFTTYNEKFMPLLFLALLLVVAEILLSKLLFNRLP